MKALILAAYKIEVFIFCQWQAAKTVVFIKQGEISLCVSILVHAYFFSIWKYCFYYRKPWKSIQDFYVRVFKYVVQIDLTLPN